jgi:CRISPR-associated endonuclease Csn1
MFLLGISNNDTSGYLKNYEKLSKYLYRVQKISNGDYSFRRHIASTLVKQEEEWRIASMKAWKDANPIKLDIDLLGSVK